MYEIRLTDVPDRLLARVQRLDQSAQAVEALVDLTRDQLLANNEGASGFRMTFGIYDQTGQHIDDIPVCLGIPARPE